MAWHTRTLRLLSRNLRTQAKYDYAQENNSSSYFPKPAGLATPKQVPILSNRSLDVPDIPSQLVQYLDEFIIGQENAKKVLSVACVNDLLVCYERRVSRT